MKELSQSTALIFDHGLFISIGERLARDDGFGRVLYHTPFEEGFSTLNKGILGDGFDRIERCNDIWEVKDEVDVWIFPDIEHSGLQKELESQGRAVWGSRDGDSHERLREQFHKTLGRLGLDVPKHRVIQGLTKLRGFLQSNDGPWYIKISKWRGSFETVKFRSWAIDEALLDVWAVRFGPAKELIPFMVFDPIETELEIGGDTWCIDGHWPDLMLHGDENKDRALLTTVTSKEEMPEQLRKVMDAFGSELALSNYRNFWSMEVRVKGKESFFGDATCRAPMPSTATHMEIWENLPEVINAGAHGEIVQPIPAKKFAGEVILEMKCEERAWGVTEIPPKLKQWIKLADCCEIDGRSCFPPDDSDTELIKIGWMVAMGDTIEEMIETMNAQVAELPDGVTTDILPLAELLEIVASAEDKGIEFTDQEIPEPETVIQNGD